MAGKRARCWKVGALMSLVLVVSACATGRPPPTDKISAAEVAVNRAQESQAGEFAALELKLAQDKLQEARAAAASGDEDQYLRAERLAEEALVDARLAEAKARAAGLEKIETEMRETMNTLRQQMQPGTQVQPE